MGSNSFRALSKREGRGCNVDIYTKYQQNQAAGRLVAAVALAQRNRVLLNPVPRVEHRTPTLAPREEPPVDRSY